MTRNGLGADYSRTQYKHMEPQHKMLLIIHAPTGSSPFSSVRALSKAIYAFVMAGMLDLPIGFRVQGKISAWVWVSSWVQSLQVLQGSGQLYSVLSLIGTFIIRIGFRDILYGTTIPRNHTEQYWYLYSGPYMKICSSLIATVCLVTDRIPYSQ